MVAPKSFEWTFFDVVAIAQKDKVFLAAQNVDFDDQDEDDEQVSYCLRWDGDWASRPVPILTVSVCHVPGPEPAVLFLGHQGVVVRLSQSVNFAPEAIDDSEDGPQHWGDMREIRALGQQAYACGMGRTVYRCDSAVWTRADQGMRVAAVDDSDVGLNSIHGFSPADLYAVGWEGEIWHFAGRNWKQIDSPTNLALLRVLCASSGKVYIGGQEGLVLRGRDRSWDELRLPDSEEDVTGSIEFKGRMYFSTSEGIYRLDDDALVPLKIQSGGKPLKTRAGESFGALDATEEVIWSVGPKMAVFSYDGIDWKEVSY